MNDKQLEQRFAAIERELASLKQRMEGMSQETPWWERIAGAFHNDDVYREAMDLGRQYRLSLHPDCSEHEGE